MHNVPKFFSWVLPLLDVKHCCKLSAYKTSGKSNKSNLKKWQKTYFGTQFWPLWHKFEPPQKFSRVLTLLDVEHCCKLSLYGISKKTNESKLKNGKNLVSGLILALLTQIRFPNSFSVGFTSTMCHKLLQAVTVCNFKEN